MQSLNKDLENLPEDYLDLLSSICSHMTTTASKFSVLHALYKGKEKLWDGHYFWTFITRDDGHSRSMFNAELKKVGAEYDSVRGVKSRGQKHSKSLITFCAAARASGAPLKDYIERYVYYCDQYAEIEIRGFQDHKSLVSKILHDQKSERTALPKQHKKHLPPEAARPSYINDICQGTLRRKSVERNLKQFIRKNNAGYAVIFGDAGTGKTTFLANVVNSSLDTNEYTISWFFASYVEGRNSALGFIKEIFSSLSLHFDLSHLQEEYDRLFTVNGDKLIAHFIASLLNEASRASSKEINKKPVLLVVDAIDEINGWHSFQNGVGHNPLYLPKILPPNIYILVSTRGEDFPISKSPILNIRFNSDEPEHVDTFKKYLRNKCKSKFVLAWCRRNYIEKDNFINRLYEGSGCSFAYTECLLSALPNYSVGTLPQEINSYYKNEIERFYSVSKYSQGLCRKVITALWYFKRPLSLGFLASFAGMSFSNVFCLISEMKFLRMVRVEIIDGSAFVSFSHSSFYSFVENEGTFYSSIVYERDCFYGILKEIYENYDISNETGTPLSTKKIVPSCIEEEQFDVLLDVLLRSGELSALRDVLTNKDSCLKLVKGKPRYRYVLSYFAYLFTHYSEQADDAASASLYIEFASMVFSTDGYNWKFALRLIAPELIVFMKQSLLITLLTFAKNNSKEYPEVSSHILDMFDCVIFGPDGKPSLACDDGVSSLKLDRPRGWISFLSTFSHVEYVRPIYLS